MYYSNALHVTRMADLTQNSVITTPRVSLNAG
jgi:hypothetical protein